MAPEQQHSAHSTAEWLLLEGFLFLSASAEAFVITPTSSNTFYGDFNINPAMTAAYTSFQITNDTGAPVPDLWVSIGGFGGGVLGLAPEEDGVFHVGPLAAGASSTAFFYLSASGASASPQPYSVCVYAGAPPAAPLECANLSFSAVEDTIRAGNSSVDGVILSIEVDPNPPELGGTFNMTVQGRTGTLGAAEVLAFSPASTLDWPADCYELYATEIQLESPNQGTLHDWLVVPPPLSSTVATDYTAIYSFRVVCGPTSAVEVLPATYVSSGNVVKHADVDGLGVTIYPPVPSPSATPTYTVTPSRTPTSTRTVTPSSTSTPSFTDTVTPAPSFTSTDTPTSTQTPTSTATSTPHFTDTSTSTYSVTPSYTSTVTSTHTYSSTATPTYTYTVTATFSITQSPTDTFTSSVTPSSTSSPTYTSSSTFSPSVTPSSSSTHTPSQTPTFTDSPTSTISPTHTNSPTPPPPSVNLSLRVYNAAGELVAVLAEGLNVPASFSGLGSPSQALVPDLGGGALELLGTGLSLDWDGRNSGGQRVDSGSYTAVAEVVDSFGKTSTYNTGFSVLRLPSEMKVSVYNSAGELVFEEIGAAPAFSDSSELLFSADQLLLGDGSGAKLEVRYGRLSAPLHWDGHNNQGRLVSDGLYTVKVQVTQPGLAPMVVAKQIQVLSVPGANPLESAFAVPNPAGPADRQVVIFLEGEKSGLRVRAQFFNLAGERLAQADNSAQPDRLVWDLEGAASGVYLAVLETQGERPQRRVIKVAVKK